MVVSDKSYKRRFVVYGLSKNSAEEEIIPGLQMSVVQYFKNRHNIDLKYPHLPCVKVSVVDRVEVDCFCRVVCTHAFDVGTGVVMWWWRWVVLCSYS